MNCGWGVVKMKNELEEQLETILTEVFPEIDFENHDKDKAFYNQITYDSMGVMNLVILIKKNLAISLSPAEINEIKSFNDLLKILNS